MKTAFLTKMKQLVKPQDRLLLAVSGGLDSMVLLELSRFLPNAIAVAHVNFQLRGEESDADADFVKRNCENQELTCFTACFNTEQYAKSQKVSIEMAARELRYAYFQELVERERFDFVLVAHHQEDQAETLLLNLTRGTGLKGMMGMQEKRANILRPLLSFSRLQIESFAKENALAFRTDKSNADLDFRRNKIRHQITPVLKEINPAYVQTMSENAKRFQETAAIYQAGLLTLTADCTRKTPEGLEILIEKLLLLPAKETILFELLRPYGFQSKLISTILKQAATAEIGKVFYSHSHRLIRTPDTFILVALEAMTEEPYFITEKDCFVKTPLSLKLERVAKLAEFNSQTAYFDLSQLEFPLSLRKWQKGDRFVPFGMKGSQKVSDFFSNQKLNLLQKEAVWLLCSGKNIIWLIGHRASEKGKVTAYTKEILKITLLEKDKE